MDIRERAGDALYCQARSEATLALGREYGKPSRYCPTLPKASDLAATIDAWGLMIEGVEAAGWTLEHWAIDPDGNARPVFRAP